MTNFPGCFNVGESDFQYHGANRLGANSLLSCIFGGLIAGIEVPRYLETLKASYGNLPSRTFSDALAQEESFKHDLMTREGPENVHQACMTNCPIHDSVCHGQTQQCGFKKDSPCDQRDPRAL